MNASLQIQKILNESHDLHGFCEDLTQRYTNFEQIYLTNSFSACYETSALSHGIDLFYCLQ